MLSLAPFGLASVTVAMDEDCPTPLKTAVLAHPRLQIVATPPGARSDLRIVCHPADEAKIEGATLRFHPQHRPERIAFAPHWSDAGGPIDWPPLQTAWLSADATVPHPGEFEPLFGAAGHPLITGSRATPRVIDVFLDIAQPSLTRQPEYPALLDGLITFALGRSLLDETFAAERSVAESRVAPDSLPSAQGSTPIVAGHNHTDLGPFLALLAALLLAADLLRSRRPAREMPRQSVFEVRRT
jgi:hypothetical protein